MNKLIRFGIIAAFVGVGTTGVAFADSASTTGGIKIKSDDGNFEAAIGGRVHFDAAYLDPDADAFGSTATKHYGSNGFDNASGTYLRRAFLTLTGKAYGWEYKLEDDLTGGQRGSSTVVTSAAGYQDLYIAHALGGESGMLYMGQKKPWRSFEELQSNNEILFMERPVTGGGSLYGGRDFQQGLFYRYAYKPLNLWAGVSLYSLEKVGAAGSTQGSGTTARIAWAPINATGKLVHVGFTYASDHADNGAALSSRYTYAGYGLNTADTITVANYAGVSGVAGYGNATANTWTGELAGIFGPAYLEGEFAHEGIGAKSQAQSAAVDAFYVQSSVFLTGESKSYRSNDAVVAGNPKPKHSYGAVELKVRYEAMMNNSIESTAIGSAKSVFGCTVTNAPTSGTVSACRVSDIAGGINYYVNPNVRFMLDYISAKADLGGTVHADRANTIAGRVQIAF